MRYILLLSLLLSSCVADYDDNEDYTVPERPLMVNAPFPEGADTLRVLAIGNSFTENATSYLRALTDSSAIDPDRLGIYILTYAGARFSHWNEAIGNGEQVRATRVTGTVPMSPAVGCHRHTAGKRRVIQVEDILYP